MTALVQICIVVVTLAFVALVAVTVRALIKLGQETARLTAAAQLSSAQVERIVQETQDLLATVREIVPPAKIVLNRMQGIGERVADLSAAVLGEIEEPVFTAVALARGVKAGTGLLAELIARRVAPHHPTNNGDRYDE